jgi:flagellar biosynthetic protein FlhB
MALFDDSDDSRTERPTERRRQHVREEGKVARSTELLIAARTLSIWIVLGWWFASFANLARTWLHVTFQHAGETSHSVDVLGQLREQAWRFGATASWPLLIATLAILLAHFLQVGWLWRWNQLAPQSTRLSPLSGLQRLFSSATAGRALAILLKLTIVIGVSAMPLAQILSNTKSNSTTDFSGQFADLATSALQVVLQFVFALLFFGTLDYGWQRWRFERSLLMTREEVREELKEVESERRQKNQSHAFVNQLPHSHPANSSLASNTSHSS